MFLVGESRGTAASSPTAGCPSTSVRSGSLSVGSSTTAGNGLVTGGAVLVVGVAVLVGPEEKEIDPPAL